MVAPKTLFRGNEFSHEEKKKAELLPKKKIHILDNTKNLSSQARADMACKLVGSVLHESASNVLSSPNYQPQHTHSRQPPPATTTHHPGHQHTNPTPDAKTLRTEIQILRNTIAAKSNENSQNPFLANLNLQLNQKCKTLKQVYKKQNSAHLLAHAHELKVTPFTTTINTAWKLLRDYKGNDSSASPQLPSQMHTNISAHKRIFSFSPSSPSPFSFSRLGMNPKQIVSYRHSTHSTHPTRKSQTLNSTKPLLERKLRKCKNTCHLIRLQAQMASRIEFCEPVENKPLT